MKDTIKETFDLIKLRNNEMKDILNTMKNNLDFTSYIKIKTLIEGSINKVKQDIKNNEQFPDPYLDKM